MKKALLPSLERLKNGAQPGSYEEFYFKVCVILERDALSDHGGLAQRPVGTSAGYLRPGIVEPWRHDYDPENLDIMVLSTQWTTGGLTGGSCWGDEANCPVDPDVPGELPLLQIYENLCPGITYLQAKKIESKIEHEDWTDSGYYGNYTHRRIAFLRLRDLYNAMKELKLI